MSIPKNSTGSYDWKNMTEEEIDAARRQCVSKAKVSIEKVKSRMENHQNRAHRFTINNYTENDIKCVNECKCDYMVYSFEVGEKNNVPHIQGFCYHKCKISMKALNKRLGNRANIGLTDGTPEQNRTYIIGPYTDKKTGKSKPYNPNHKEFGILPKKGKRNDLETITEMIKKKEPLKEIFEANPGTFIRYHKGIQVARQLYFTDRTTKPYVIWISGEAGIGKSKWVYDNYKSVYPKDGTMWWDNYEQHECILVDDFDCKWPFRDLLRFIDRYPYQGQIKGGYVKINSPYIVFTCDVSLHEAYSHLTEKEFAQLYRRFSELKCIEAEI